MTRVTVDWKRLFLETQTELQVVRAQCDVFEAQLKTIIKTDDDTSRIYALQQEVATLKSQMEYMEIKHGEEIEDLQCVINDKDAEIAWLEKRINPYHDV